MITEDYVSFEAAKLLKEKGFDEKCHAFYRKTLLNNKIIDKAELHISTHLSLTNSNLQDKLYKEIVYGVAPTLQMAMKWLREEKHFYIQVMLDSWAYGSHSGYYVVIQKTDSEFEIMLADKLDKVFYDEPEEAYEAAIKYILENLI